MAQGGRGLELVGVVSEWVWLERVNTRTHPHTVTPSHPHTLPAGNIGSVLLDSRLSRDDDRLYFSHDGGFTWQTVASGLWDFQFAAIGSIVATVSWRSAPISNVRCEGVRG